MKTLHTPRLSNLLAALALGLASSYGHAQEVVDLIATPPGDPWTWTDGANWDGGAAPGTTEIAGINNRSAGTLVVNPSTSVGGIRFSDTSNRTISIGSGRTLTLHGTGTEEITHLSNVGTAVLNFSGNGFVKLQRSGAVHVAEGGAITFSARLASDTAALVKTGEGRLSLTRTDNTFSSDITVHEGILSTNQSSISDGQGGIASGPFGTGAIHLKEGSALTYSATTVAGTLHNRLVLEGDASFGIGTETRGISYVGGVDLHGGTRMVTTEQETTFASVVSNGGLTKAGASQLTLSGVNSYTGETRVREGVLRLEAGGSIAASSRIIVETGGTLALHHGGALTAGQVLTGSGTITGTFQLGAGRLEAGETAMGSLNIAANTLLNGGEIALRLSQGSHDQLLLSGSGLTLTGNTSGAVQLILSDFDGSTVPGSYLLISTAELDQATFSDWGVTTFSLTLPTHWNGALRMEENQLYLDLQAIPEPRVALLLLGGGLLVLARRIAT